MAKKIEQPKLIIIGKQEVVAPVVPIFVPPIKIQLDFNSWWLLAQQRLHLRSDMKIAIEKHFQARGFMVSQDFDLGLIDFGIKS